MSVRDDLMAVFIKHKMCPECGSKMKETKNGLACTKCDFKMSEEAKGDMRDGMGGEKGMESKP